MFFIAPQTHTLIFLPNMGPYGPVVIEFGYFFYNLDSLLRVKFKNSTQVKKSTQFFDGCSPEGFSQSLKLSR